MLYLAPSPGAGTETPHKGSGEGAQGGGASPETNLSPQPDGQEPSRPDGNPGIPSQPEITKPTPIDVNRATVEELQELWNIGPQKAQAIVEWRLRRGPFRTLQDLERVPGIGPETVRRNRHRIRFGTGRGSR